jgi:hypothetical protein
VATIKKLDANALLHDTAAYVLTIISNLVACSKNSMLIFFRVAASIRRKNNIQTLLLTAPPYVLAVISTFLNSWHAGRNSLPPRSEQTH